MHFLMIDSSENAVSKDAAIFSVVESCRRPGVPIRQFLLDVLPGLLNRSIKSVAQLTQAPHAANRAK
jgi:transposase